MGGDVHVEVENFIIKGGGDDTVMNTNCNIKEVYFRSKRLELPLDTMVGMH